MKRFRKAILHVGTHKTGTTAIQRWADLHRADLLEHGILYPQTGQWHDRSHHQWSFSLWGNYLSRDKTRSLDSLMDELEAETATVDADTVLLSSELLEKMPTQSNRFDTMTAWAQALAERVDVVIFIRRQDLLLESLFKQHVKDAALCYNGSFNEFRAFQRRALNYLQLFRAWRAAPFTNRIIGVSNALRANPVTDFLQALGLDISNAEHDDRSTIVNPTLDGMAIEFKHFCNCLPLASEHQKRLFQVIRKAQFPHETLSLLTDAARESLLDEYSTSNRMVTENFNLEPFDNSWPQRDRPFRRMFGQTLFECLGRIAEVDEKVAWAVSNAITNAAYTLHWGSKK